MSDDEDPFYSPNLKPSAARVGRPGELLFEFVRAADRAPMSCELRFHGECYGWEAQFFERGELLYSRGGFVTRALAVQWAEEERTTMEVVSAVIALRPSASRYETVARRTSAVPAFRSTSLLT
jgi:hypothetical protein